MLALPKRMWAGPWSGLDPDTLAPAFRPVPGWKAEKRILLQTEHGVCVATETYHIEQCPMFDDERRK